MNFVPPKTEGAGKAGCALHPRSRVQMCNKKCAHEHTGSAESIRPSLRSGFTAYFVLSPVNGSFATVACGYYRKLDASTAASGPHDFAVRDRPRSSVVAPASTASHRNVRDDRDPPLICRETRGVEAVICPTGRVEYFCAWGWTDFW
jgi:hypothetical protein